MHAIIEKGSGSHKTRTCVSREPCFGSCRFPGKATARLQNDYKVSAVLPNLVWVAPILGKAAGRLIVEKHKQVLAAPAPEHYRSVPPVFPSRFSLPAVFCMVSGNRKSSVGNRHLQFIPHFRCCHSVGGGGVGKSITTLRY